MLYIAIRRISVKDVLSFWAFRFLSKLCIYSLSNPVNFTFKIESESNEVFLLPRLPPWPKAPATPPSPVLFIAGPPADLVSLLAPLMTTVQSVVRVILLGHTSWFPPVLSILSRLPVSLGRVPQPAPAARMHIVTSGIDPWLPLSLSPPDIPLACPLPHGWLSSQGTS